MKVKLYNILVNRHGGIKERYHQFHDGTCGIKKYLSWLYLLWLNFGYYILQFRFLGLKKEAVIYEEKKLQVKQSESELVVKEGICVSSFVEKLSSYEVISFDIFDTLIFRPFSEPTDLFYFVGEKLEVMNFKELRGQMEQKAREKKYQIVGHYEVTLEDIWNQLECEVGICAKIGKQVEIETENKFCYANPFMLEVYRELQKKGKRILIVSDMYLPKSVLQEILHNNGYREYEKLYVSCEYGKSKATGSLFEIVGKENQGRMVHVGDNTHSDVTMAKKYGIDTCYYPNVNRNSKKYRAYDMSCMIGGAYRGIVNHHLYQGLHSYSMEYEYGFIYGGLFVTGYCNFIREYGRKNQIDKVLFLSRDGDIIKKAYDILFPEEKTEYVYWSRRAATKLMAKEDKQDYFRRFLYHKVNQKISLEQILISMELEFLVEKLPKFLQKTTLLTDRNVEEVKAFLESVWEEILLVYEREQEGAKAYYTKVLQGCKKVVAVDIGWAGSGAIALHYLVHNVWKLPCEVVGIVAGTNTMYSSEPEASETFLQSGRLVSYLYSQRQNRDLLKKHDPNRKYNVYWELLVSSPTPQLKGFHLNVKNGLVFGEYDKNLEGIREIQKGILAFVREYQKHFGDSSFMYQISGRDAYAPMLLAAGKGENYLKEIEQRFFIQENIS